MINQNVNDHTFRKGRPGCDTFLNNVHSFSRSKSVSGPKTSVVLSIISYLLIESSRLSLQANKTVLAGALRKTKSKELHGLTLTVQFALVDIDTLYNMTP